jgi:hypothetical protein
LHEDLFYLCRHLQRDSAMIEVVWLRPVGGLG